MPKKKTIHGTQVCNGRKTHDLQYYCDKSKNSVYLHGLDLTPFGKLVRIVPWHAPMPQTGKLEEHFLLVVVPSCFYYCSCNCHCNSAVNMGLHGRVLPVQTHSRPSLLSCCGIGSILPSFQVEKVSHSISRFHVSK